MPGLYGIRNCDTMRKAMAWLDRQGIDYEFHDYRRDGLSQDLLEDWIAQLGWEALLNRRGTTWRKLAAERREDLDAQSAAALMREQPTLIRRPVLVAEQGLLVGFDADSYQNFFA